MAKQANRASNQLTDLSVTIYPSYALIQGTYRVKLNEGQNKFQLEGLPTHYDPSSLYIDQFQGPGEVILGPSAYKPANLNNQTVLAKSINKKVTVRFGGALESEQEEINGRLLALNGNIALLELKGGVVREVRNVVGFTYKKLPEGLSNTPALYVTVEADKAGDYEVTLLYKALGINWQADYKWIYDEKAGTITWDGSVFVNNGSGASYDSANLKVVAGDAGEDSHLESAGGMQPMMAAASFDASESVRSRGVRQATNESVGQVKVFSVPGKTTLEEGESPKVPFLVVPGTPVTPEYRVRASRNWHARGVDKMEQPVRTILGFTNDEEHKLGFPLPSGAIEVLMRDSAGTLLKSGGGSIADVAVGAEEKVDTGADFDLKATRIVRNVTQTEEVIEEAQEASEGKKARPEKKKWTTVRDLSVELFNGKDRPIVFVVEEALSDDTEFTGGKSLTKVSAKAWETTITVEPGQKASVDYQVTQTVIR